MSRARETLSFPWTRVTWLAERTNGGRRVDRTRGFFFFPLFVGSLDLSHTTGPINKIFFFWRRRNIWEIRLLIVSMISKSISCILGWVDSCLPGPRTESLYLKYEFHKKRTTPSPNLVSYVCISFSFLFLKKTLQSIFHRHHNPP